MFVCICKSVTDRDIKTAVKRGCGSYEGVCAKLGVASCCGRCQMHAREVIDEVRAEILQRSMMMPSVPNFCPA